MNKNHIYQSAADAVAAAAADAPTTAADTFSQRANQSWWRWAGAEDIVEVHRGDQVHRGDRRQNMIPLDELCMYVCSVPLPILVCICSIPHANTRISYSSILPHFEYAALAPEMQVFGRYTEQKMKCILCTPVYLKKLVSLFRHHDVFRFSSLLLCQKSKIYILKYT